MITKNLRDTVLHTLRADRPRLITERADTALMDMAAIHRVWQLGAGSLSPTHFQSLETVLEILALRQRDANYGEALPEVDHG